MTDQANASLYQRAYLIACDPQRGHPYNRQRTALVVRAAVLVDLAYRRAAHEVGGRVHVDDVGDLADPVLATAASEMMLRSRSWRAWIRHGYKQTLTLVEERLLDEGVLAGRPSGLEPNRPATVRDLAAIVRLQARVRSVLVGEEPDEGTDRNDAALAVLAVAGGVPLVPRGYRVQYRTRYLALAAQAGEGFPGIEPALSKLRRTIIAARGGMG